MLPSPADRPWRRVRSYALRALMLLACAALPPCRPAAAHAILMESQPAVQGVVPAGSLPVRLRFNSRIDAARSRLLLLRGDRAVSFTQDALPLLPADGPDRLASQVVLPAGEYVLRWQVLAVDGHITRGDVPFRVEGR